MLSPNQELAMFQERKRQLIHSARMNQLLRQAEEDRPQFGERLMTLVADLMISSGEKLKARSTPRYTVSAQNG
ncbi:MAG: hypothetical protein ABI835_07845 [Chloroflexota bacterium]